MLPESSEQPFVAPPNLRLHPQLQPVRLRDRLALLKTLQSTSENEATDNPGRFHQRATDMLTADAAGRAFDLNREHSGQSTEITFGGNRRFSRAGWPNPEFRSPCLTTR